MIADYEVALVNLIEELVKGHHFLFLADPFGMESDPDLKVPMV